MKSPMKTCVQYALYDPGLNCFIQERQADIPECWTISKEKFLHSSLYYTKLLARLMIIDLIRTQFLKFDPVKASRENEKLMYSGLSVSVSYSGNMVLAGIAVHGLIGIDLEVIAPVDFSLFEQILTHDERAWLNQAIDRFEAFYTLWTRKEAVVKADGRGFAVELSSFSSLPDQIRLPNASQNWNLISFRFWDTYLFSLASSTIPGEIKFNPFIIS